MKYILIACALAFSLNTGCASRIVVKQPNKVTVVKTRPNAYKIVKVKGHRYYNFNGRYHKKTRKCYVGVKV